METATAEEAEDDDDDDDNNDDTDDDDDDDSQRIVGDGVEKLITEKKIKRKVRR